jgi:integral membrane protein
MMQQLIKTSLGQLRIIGFLEGCSFLLLGITMILKYKFTMPQPNYVVGMFHGVLFIAYVFWVINVAFAKKWSLLITFLALAASLIPFGTFIADKKIFSKAN